MPEALKGKVAIVTGAGRGIGAAVARLFASEGARVVLASRTAAELDAVREEIEGSRGPGAALGVPTDVGDEAAIVRLFDRTIETFGACDVLVNNAGAIASGDFADFRIEDWNRVVAVNQTGVFLASREAFRRLRALGRPGVILNVSSLGGIRGTEKFPGFAAYTVSKYAVVGLTECLAVEGRPLGVRVNCVAPGAVDTAMLRAAAPGLRTRTRPEDVARVALFLCDDRQSGSLSGTVVEIHSNL